MAVKDALTGSSPQGVLDAAEQGEDEHRPPERVRDGEKEFLDRQGNQRF